MSLTQPWGQAKGWVTAEWLPQTDAMAAWACYFRFFCSEMTSRSFAGGG